MLPEFKKRIDTLRDILVGAVPSPAGQIEQITYALIYKFMSDIDDKSSSIGGKRTYFTGEYEKYSWHELMAPTLGAHDRLALYREALGSLAKNPGLPELFQGIYQNAYLTFNDPRVLTLFLKEIDNFKHSTSDDIGDAYEYLLQITGAQGDVGQFRTPRHIIKFIVEAVNPTKSDSVLDPAVGTAGFLIAAYNHVKHHHDGVDEITGLPDKKEEHLSADELDKLHKNYHGFDIDPTMVRTAKVNMYLHGFTTPDIKNHDSLSSEDWWNERYDVILANPPFMSPKGGIKPHEKFGIKANRAEVLFVDYIASHLKPTGRAGIVVPEGIIFQSGKAYRELRKNLVDNHLYAVVSLPAGVFQPYSGVKTSVLLLDKELAKQRDSVLFIKIENDGYSLGAQRRETGGSQFSEALELINKFREGTEIISELAHSVSRADITLSDSYNLNGDRYKISTAHEQSSWPIVQIGDIAEVISGQSPEGKYYNETGDGLPFYQGKTEFTDNIIGKPQKWTTSITKTAEKNDILMSVRAPVGPVNLACEKICIGRGLAAIRTKDESVALQRYLYCVIKNIQDTFKSLSSGSTFESINRNQIENVKIPLPPIEIQREIVSELDGYQKIIDAAQTIVKTYKPTIKIDHEWKLVNLGNKELFDIQSGGTPSSIVDTYWGGRVNWVTLADLPATDFVTDVISTKRKITQEGLANSSAKLLPIGTVLVSSRATIGRVAITRQETSTNQGFKNIVIRDKTNVSPEYIAAIATTLKPQMEALASGGTFKEISKTSFETIEIPLPPIDEQKQIVKELEIEAHYINSCKKLIDLYTQKVHVRITEIWGE